MLEHFAAPRMAAVQKFFQTQADSELLRVYAWTQAVSSGLLPILGDFEVAFRNALHTALSQQYGGVDSFDWMMTRPNPAASSNPAAKPLPARHKMNPRTQENVQKAASAITGKKGGVSPDDIVAALPFGIWEQIINSLDNPAQPPGLQAAILSRVFPNAPDLATIAYHSKAFKNRVVSLLTRIRETRNRIGHHDSIWVIPAFSLAGTVGFLPRHPRHSVTNLKLFADSLCWLSGWISPTIPTYIRRTDHWWSFQALLSREALAIYRSLGGNIGTYKALMDIYFQPRRNLKDKAARFRSTAFRRRLLRYHY